LVDEEPGGGAEEVEGMRTGMVVTMPRMFEVFGGYQGTQGDAVGVAGTIAGWG
jgi:hypothetical protein